MKDCLNEQKETETKLHLADILLTEKSIEELKTSLSEYDKGLEQSLQAK